MVVGTRPTDCTTVAPAARTPSSRAGLTLIEITVALAVLSVMVLGLFSALSSSMAIEAATREHQAASEAAMREMDLQMSVPNINLVTALQANPKEFHVQVKTGKTDAAGALVVTNLPAAEVPINADDVATAADESAMAGRVEVNSDPDGDGQVNLVEITVSVKWRTVKGGPQVGGRDARIDVRSMRVVVN